MLLILDLIRSKFGDLTIPEIQNAFKMYVARELPVKVFRLLDCISVGEVLGAYKTFRNESLRVYDDKKRNQNKLSDMTESAKEQQLIDGTNRRFTDFIEGLPIDEPCEHIFDFLVEKGEIKTGNNPKLLAYYDEKLLQAKKQVLSEERSKLMAASPTERHDIKEQIQAIENGSSPKAVILAKKLVLSEYFGKKKENGFTKIF